VADAVDFWNQQLTEIGSGFRLGAVKFVSEILSGTELTALSQAMLNAQRALVSPPSGFMQIEGDLIIALSDGAFVSFAMSFQKTDKRLIAIRSFHAVPFRFTNVGRNLMAHELGHAIGLGHNDDRSKLMCGRPAPCRPDAFRSDAERFFSLTEEEKQSLLKALSADLEGRAHRLGVAANNRLPQRFYCRRWFDVLRRRSVRSVETGRRLVDKC
jgi:hypothetical protein